MKYITATNMQRLFSLTVILSVIIGAGVFVFNYTSLQRSVDRVIEQDARNTGVRVSVYFDGYIHTDTIVFDVRAVGAPAGYNGMFRVFFQFAREMQGRKIDEVILAYNGRRKFKVSGDDFLEMGAGFGAMQSKELIWELAHNLRLLNGRLVMSQVPGDYASLLQKNLGDEGQAASALFNSMTR